MHTVKKVVLHAFLALGILVGAVAVVAPSSVTAHAAAARSSAAATTNCAETYWNNDNPVDTQYFSFPSGTDRIDVHLDVLRDAYTNYYCGQYRIKTCAFVPYMLDPSHTYKLSNQIDLNGSYVTFQSYQWVSPNPGYETTVCLSKTTHSGSRGSVVGVYAQVMAVTANVYGHPYFQFSLY